MNSTPASVGVAEHGESGTVELLAELGCRDGYKKPGTVNHIFAAEVDGTVFGDNPVGLEAGCHHSGTRGEYGLDFAFSTRCCRQHGYERLAPTLRDEP